VEVSKLLMAAADVRIGCSSSQIATLALALAMVVEVFEAHDVALRFTSGRAVRGANDLFRTVTSACL